MIEEENYTKILPMKYPEITSYPHHANLISILSHNEENMSWFYNHYFQLVMERNGNNRLDFNIGYSILPFIKNCPLITYHGLSRDFISMKWSSFSNFIVDSINLGYYLYFVVDKFYVPAYEDQYLKKHVPHDIFVFGYNTNQHMFNVADFFKNGKYYYTECPFSKIEEGFIAGDNFDWINGVVLLKKNSESHTLDVKLLKDYIDDYLRSNNSNHRTVLINNNLTDDIFAFGIEIYDVIEKHIQKISSNDNFFDIRPYHILWDHKKYISLLIKFLCRQGYLNRADYFYKNFIQIEEKALILRNLMIKYKITKNKSLIEKAIKMLKEIALKEKLFLQEMLDNIHETVVADIRSNTSIDCTSLALEYSESWHKDSSEYFSTETKDAWVQLMFYGSSINYNATRDEHCGYADIFIDGYLCDSVTLYSIETKYDEIGFSKNDLPLGFHTIRIVCKGEKDVLSFGNKISVGRLLVHSSSSAIKIRNELHFLGCDNTTKGSWYNVYGSQGYDIVCDSRQVPTYAHIQYFNANQHMWQNNSKDICALQSAHSQNIRIAAQKYNNSYLDIKLIICGYDFKDVALYLLDFDGGRKIQITTLDGDTSYVLHSQDICDFKEGIYLRYKMKGNLIIRITCLEGHNATFSGVFFN